MMTLKDGKQTPATPAWDFVCENYAFTGKACIQIAKAEKVGMLKITIDTTDPGFFIGGVVYVYLKDQTALVCTDKRLHENKDGKTWAWYSFSAIEMNKLKTTDIESIRFNIRGNAKKFSSQTGNLTAVNKKSYFSVTNNKPAIYETAAAISALYQQQP
jgi:hypothetical protein